MSTAAEIAAGRALYAQFKRFFADLQMAINGHVTVVDWEVLSAELQAEYIADGMAIVNAYRLGEIGEPIRTRTIAPLLVNNGDAPGCGVLSPWGVPRVHVLFDKSDQWNTIRVQNLPPLPEPKL